MKIQLGFGSALLLTSLIISNNFVFAIIYILCATAHEIGHLLAAKLLNIKISKLTLDFAGAKIIPSGEISSYQSEFLLCAAGPVTSFTLCALTFFILRKSGVVLDFSNILAYIDNPELSRNCILILIFIFSIVQGGINLIPISGFDGGRMLASATYYVFGTRAGHAISKIMTFLFAFFLWLISVYFLIRVGQGLSLFSFSLCLFLKILEE